jgi:hypothetical protein
MSRYKEPTPLQRGSITSISLFEHGKMGEAGRIEFKLAEVRDRTKDNKGFFHCYVGPTEQKFILPDDVYRSNGLPRVKPEDIKKFVDNPHYKFKRFVAFMP